MSTPTNDAPRAARDRHTIEVRVAELWELFDAIDPSDDGAVRAAGVGTNVLLVSAGVFALGGVGTGIAAAAIGPR